MHKFCPLEIREQLTKTFHTSNPEMRFNVNALLPYSVRKLIDMKYQPYG